MTNYGRVTDDEQIMWGVTGNEGGGHTSWEESKIMRGETNHG